MTERKRGNLIEYLALIISIIALCTSVWTWWHGTREENWAIDFDLTEWGNVEELKMDGTNETGQYNNP